MSLCPSLHFFTIAISQPAEYDHEFFYIFSLLYVPSMKAVLRRLSTLTARYGSVQ